MIKIAIPTHNRATSCLRAIQSIIESPLKSSVIVSNSGDQTLCKDTEDLTSVTIYEGEKRQNWINSFELSCRDQGIPSRIVQFALNPTRLLGNGYVTTGANRNFLLLLLAGEKFISVDDDVIFDVKRMNHADPNVIPSSTLNPCDLMYFMSFKDLQENSSTQPLISMSELTTAHESFLNYRKNELQCALSVSGFYGDSGQRSGRGILAWREDSITELASKDFLHRALNGRWVWKETADHKLLKLSPLMCVCTGFANDLELPPFFPIGRNQDGSYAPLLQACNSSLYIGHVGYSVFHLPQHERQNDDSLKLRINDLMILIFKEFLASEKCSSYPNVSTYLKDLADQSHEAFSSQINSIVKNHYLGFKKNLIRKIEQFTTKNLPNIELWVEYASSDVREIDKLLNSTQFIPSEFEDGQNEFQQALLLYGDLLRSWPKMRSIASAKNSSQSHS